MTTMHCPDCDCDITGVTVDEITDCADHASFEALQEAYRWLREENKRIENRFFELASRTLAAKLEANLKEANQSRAKLGAERYLLEKKVEELESKARYWKATADEYEEALKELIVASEELLKAEEIF